MSRVDLHPEELLDRARRGQVSDLESERLEAHLEGCRACRFEQALSLDCAEGAAALPGDELVIARVRRATLRALEARTASRPGSLGRRWSPSPVLWVAVAAVVLLGALTAGATLAGRSRRTAASREPVQPRITFLPLPTLKNAGAAGTAPGIGTAVEGNPTPPRPELEPASTPPRQTTSADRPKLAEMSIGAKLRHPGSTSGKRTRTRLQQDR